eukprot:g48429.t1
MFNIVHKILTGLPRIMLGFGIARFLNLNLLWQISGSQVGMRASTLQYNGFFFGWLGLRTPSVRDTRLRLKAVSSMTSQMVCEEPFCGAASAPNLIVADTEPDNGSPGGRNSGSLDSTSLRSTSISLDSASLRSTSSSLDSTSLRSTIRRLGTIDINTEPADGKLPRRSLDLTESNSRTLTPRLRSSLDTEPNNRIPHQIKDKETEQPTSNSRTLTPRLRSSLDTEPNNRIPHQIKDKETEQATNMTLTPGSVSSRISRNWIEIEQPITITFATHSISNRTPRHCLETEVPSITSSPRRSLDNSANGRTLTPRSIKSRCLEPEANGRTPRSNSAKSPRRAFDSTELISRAPRSSKRKPALLLSIDTEGSRSPRQPRRSLETEHPRCSLESEQPRRSLETVQPRRSVEGEQPTGRITPSGKHSSSRSPTGTTGKRSKSPRLSLETEQSRSPCNSKSPRRSTETEPKSPVNSRSPCARESERESCKSPRWWMWKDSAPEMASEQQICEWWFSSLRTRMDNLSTLSTSSLPAPTPDPSHVSTTARSSISISASKSSTHSLPDYVRPLPNPDSRASVSSHPPPPRVSRGCRRLSHSPRGLLPSATVTEEDTSVDSSRESSMAHSGRSPSHSRFRELGKSLFHSRGDEDKDKQAETKDEQPGRRWSQRKENKTKQNKTKQNKPAKPLSLSSSTSAGDSKATAPRPSPNWWLWPRSKGTSRVHMLHRPDRVAKRARSVPSKSAVVSIRSLVCRKRPARTKSQPTIS